jgi:hypothetical protein
LFSPAKAPVFSENVIQLAEQLAYRPDLVTRVHAIDLFDVPEEVNVLQVLCDLIDLVTQMNTQLAAHVHGPSPVPATAALFSTNATTGQQLNGQLKPITGA